MHWLVERLLGQTLEAIDRAGYEGRGTQVISNAIAYRGALGRTKVMTAGATTGMLLAAFPAFGDAITATAHARGIRVQGPENEATDSDERRSEIDALRRRHEELGAGEGLADEPE